MRLVYISQSEDLLYNPLCKQHSIFVTDSYKEWQARIDRTKSGIKIDATTNCKEFGKQKYKRGLK